MNVIPLLLLVFLSFNINARSLTDSERVAVEKTIREEMKDPDAAKFHHQDFPYPEETYTYCGYVNGKNSYGAYAGKQLFAVMVDRDVALSFTFNKSTGKQQNPEIIAARCASGGYDLPILKMFFDQVNKDRSEKGIPLLDKNYIKRN